MINIAAFRIIDEAKAAFTARDRAGALALADRYAIAVASDLFTASAEELPEIVGPLAMLYADMEEWELAALKYADLCMYTEKHFPGTVYTASDWWRLSWYRRDSGDVHGAIQALERAALHMQQTERWPKLQQTYREELRKLRELAASA